MAYYVGLSGIHRILFRSDETPTQAEYGRFYRAVIGPFRTKRGAIFMRDCGRNNPHCQNVSDAERLVKVCISNGSFETFKHL